MKKSVSLLALVLSLFFMPLASFAGDVAVFEDLGFSTDGKTYIFAQYGKTDKKFQAWAEIYTVNVEKNDYVKNEVYKTEPSSQTVKISGKKAFEELLSKTEWKRAKYNAKPGSAEELLYVREIENKNPTSEIIFKDFESSTEEQQIYYHVKLVPTFEGSGKNVKSKFYINLSKQDQDGNTLQSWKVGTPDFKRKGISSYQINKIFTDKSGKSLVFIVEKTLEDDTGTSIRYMIEAIRL